MIEYQALHRCTFVGIPFRQSLKGPNDMPARWAACYADGTAETLRNLPNLRFGPALLGWLGDFDAGTQTFGYWIGVVLADAPDTPLSAPFARKALPDCLLAMGTLPTGPQGAHAKNRELYSRDGYELDPDKGFEMEYYEGTKEDGIFKYCSPVRKKPAG